MSAAGWLQGGVGDWSPFLVLLALYAVVAVVTEFMSDAASAALLAPLAAALAQGLGQPPEPFVVTGAMASVTAFLSRWRTTATSSSTARVATGSAISRAWARRSPS